MVDSVKGCYEVEQAKSRHLTTAATSRSLNTFVTAVSVLWNRRYADYFRHQFIDVEECPDTRMNNLLKQLWDKMTSWTPAGNSSARCRRARFSSEVVGRLPALNSVGKQPVSKDLLNSEVRKGDNKSHISFTSHEGAGSSWHVLFNADLISASHRSQRGAGQSTAGFQWCAVKW